MPWIAVDCHAPDHPKWIDLPSDTARWGWVVVLTKAKLQRNAGRFASAKHFAQVCRPYGRFLDKYLAAGLLEKDGDQIIVHDWQKHQWAAAKAGQREDNGETSGGQEEDSRARHAVDVPVIVSSSSGVEGVQGETGADALDVYYRLTGSWPSQKVTPWLSRLIDSHGDSAVADALTLEWSADPSRSSILGRVNDRLEREAHEAAKQREAAKKAAAAEELRKIQEMPEEQRAANRERLAQMMVDAGLMAKPQ